MKRIFLTLLFSICYIYCFSQAWNKHCYYGISFEKSTNRNWGYGELIITDVETHSPAEKAGLKVNDIIMEINDKATFLRDDATIAAWLFDNPDPVVRFTIRNIDTYFKEYTLNRECITVNSVDEKYLATIFSFYSLESSNQQPFTLPLQVSPNKDVDYTDYHSFGFHQNPGSEFSEIDLSIQTILADELTQMGLNREDNDPDIWVMLHYEYTSNPLFTAIEDPSASASSMRYNVGTRQMEVLPIFDINEMSVDTKGQYIAKLGFSFYDKKHINPKEFTEMWTCNIQDYLSSNYTLLEYAKFHIPLMAMQYPYSEIKNESEYFVNFSRYNYTGLYFDADNMEMINDVDQDSPAFKVGLRAGYKIQKLDKKAFNFSKMQMTDGYRSFIENTLQYRDPQTKFKGVEGYEECMLWNPIHYSQIAKEFNKTQYNTHFAYLFGFEKYVNPKYKGTITIQAWDGMQSRFFLVKPEIKESITIKTFP